MKKGRNIAREWKTEKEVWDNNKMYLKVR